MLLFRTAWKENFICYLVGKKTEEDDAFRDQKRGASPPSYTIM